MALRFKGNTLLWTPNKKLRKLLFSFFLFFFFKHKKFLCNIFPRFSPSLLSGAMFALLCVFSQLWLLPLLCCWLLLLECQALLNIWKTIFILRLRKQAGDEYFVTMDQGWISQQERRGGFKSLQIFYYSPWHCNVVESWLMKLWLMVLEQGNTGLANVFNPLHTSDLTSIGYRLAGRHIYSTAVITYWFVLSLLRYNGFLVLFVKITGIFFSFFVYLAENANAEPILNQQLVACP